MALSRTEFLSLAPKSLADMPRVEVHTPHGTLFVRKLNSRERDAFELVVSQLRTEKGDNVSVGFRALVAAWTCCDENGSRLFEFSDVDELGKFDAETINTLFDAADDLNGITGKRTALVQKNLPTTNGDDSS